MLLFVDSSRMENVISVQTSVGLFIHKMNLHIKDHINVTFVKWSSPLKVKLWNIEKPTIIQWFLYVGTSKKIHVNSEIVVGTTTNKKQIQIINLIETISNEIKLKDIQYKSSIL